MFMCCFGPAGTVLVGFPASSKKLWRLHSREIDIFNNPLKRKGKCPWARENMVLDRLSMYFMWIPRYSGMYRWDPADCDLREMRGTCELFQNRGRRRFNVIYAAFMEDVTLLLIRLQRWSKRMLRARRSLAVCMGIHARLGAGCLLASLDEDVLAVVLDSCK